MKHFAYCDGDKSINLTFPARQMYVFNPTRGFVYFNIGDNGIPNALNAKIKVPPQSERVLPLDGISQFAVKTELPNPANPATATFYSQAQSGAIGGLSFASPIDAPIPLDSFVGESFVVRSYTIPAMVGRWLRLHWTFRGRNTNSGNLYVMITDGSQRYRMVLLNNSGNAYSNFSDFSFYTNQPLTITLFPDDSTSVWDLSLRYEFMDRAEFPFPNARRIATHGQFWQFGPAAAGVKQSVVFQHGYHSYAIGMHVRGDGTLCKKFTVTLRDNDSKQIYFELQPSNYGPGQSPANPDYAIILPGDVHNYPGGSPKGQTLPVGSVSAYETAGPNYDYQLSRSLDITVLADTILEFTPNDAGILFANVFIEYTEPM